MRLNPIRNKSTVNYMKIRTDFVSNSSSSSFVVAAYKNYTIKDFSKDLIKNIVKKSDYWYYDGLKEDELLRLQFMLNNFSLVFLGEFQFDNWPVFFIDGKNEVHYERYGKLHCGNVVMSDRDIDYRGFNINNITTKIVDVVVDGEEYTRGEAMTLEERDEYLVNKLKRYTSLNYGSDSFHPTCYKITKTTLDNTESLIRSGYLKEKPEYFDSLKERIDRGEQIFHLDINYEGGGDDLESLYCTAEDPGLFFENIPVQYVNID